VRIPEIESYKHVYNNNITTMIHNTSMYTWHTFIPAGTEALIMVNVSLSSKSNAATSSSPSSGATIPATDLELVWLATVPIGNKSTMIADDSYIDDRWIVPRNFSKCMVHSLAPHSVQNESVAYVQLWHHVYITE
jgi:hypothetical protein